MFLYKLIFYNLIALFIKLQLYVRKSYLTFDKSARKTQNTLKLLKNKIKKGKYSLPFLIFVISEMELNVNLKMIMVVIK